MALELYYTSAPKGLKPGTTGFCTVALTGGMPAPMIQKLESLGGYRPVFDVGSAHMSKNPPVCAHWRVNIGGHFYSVLSHICPTGADYQGRFNKLAHHLVVDNEEQVPAGPAWVMLQPGVMETRWAGDPQVLHSPKSIPAGPNPLRVCQSWEDLAADAGWAGMLAQAFVIDASRPVYIIYEPGMAILPLMDEALCLLPQAMRWRVTFNTFFDNLPAGLSCSWRACVAGTQAAKMAPSYATSGILVDLTSQTRKRAPDNKYVLMARTGQPAVETDTSVRLAAAPSFREPEWATGASRPTSGAAAGQPFREAAAADAAAAAARGPTRPYQPARPRRNLLFWLVAILWPILALAIAWLILAHLAGSSGGSGDRDLTMGLNRARERVKKLEGENARQRQRLGGVDEEMEDIRSTLKAEIDEANANTEKVRSEFAAYREKHPPKTAPRTRPNDNGAKPPGPKTGNGGGTETAVKELPLMFPDGFGTGTVKATDGAVVLAEVPGGVSLDIVLPFEEKKELLEPFKITRAGGKLSVGYTGQSPFGVKQDRVLGQAKVEDGRVKWEWFRRKVEQGDRDKGLWLQNALRHSVLRVANDKGKTIHVCPLISPKAIHLVPGDPTDPADHTIDSCRFDVAGPTLTVVNKGGWTPKGDKTESVSLNKSGAVVKLTLGKTGDGWTRVSAAWDAGSTIQHINAEGRKTGEAIKSAANGVTAAANQLLKNCPEYEPKVAGGAPKGPVAKAEQAVARVNAALAACNRALKDLKDTIGLTAKEGELGDLKRRLPTRKRKDGKTVISWDLAQDEAHKEKFKAYRDCQNEVNDLHERNAAKLGKITGKLDQLNKGRGPLVGKHKEVGKLLKDKADWEAMRKAVTTAATITAKIHAKKSEALIADVTLTIGDEGGSP